MKKGSSTTHKHAGLLLRSAFLQQSPRWGTHAVRAQVDKSVRLQLHWLQTQQKRRVHHKEWRCGKKSHEQIRLEHACSNLPPFFFLRVALKGDEKNIRAFWASNFTQRSPQKKKKMYPNISSVGGHSVMLGGNVEKSGIFTSTNLNAVWFKCIFRCFLCWGGLLL